MTRLTFLTRRGITPVCKKDYIITYTDIQPRSAYKAVNSIFALDFSFVLLYNIIIEESPDAGAGGERSPQRGKCGFDA